MTEQHPPLPSSMLSYFSYLAPSTALASHSFLLNLERPLRCTSRFSLW